MNDADTARDSATYSARFFEPLYAVEDRHFWFRSRNRCIAAAIRTLPGFGGVKKVIEHGCGTGYVLAGLQRIFPRAEVMGADLFPEALAFARRRFAGTLLTVDVLNSGFKDEFDLIGFFDVLEHLDDDLAVLRALRSQLRPGGSLVLSVPAHMSLWSDYDIAACHRRRYSVQQLKSQLTAAGFRVDYCTQFMSLLFPLVWVRRRLAGRRNRAGSAAMDPVEREKAELQVPALLNRALALALRPEAWCISRRLRLPAGTSLLALATRTE